ncbi:hypothetical protein ACFS6H_20220 [Terrimonas rubra]|uniref:Uncharacterized protein n=1 Tax=Terrimonas rubra TaxID=1035890 RepID=A0ABW6AE87_9BACT
MSELTSIPETFIEFLEQIKFLLVKKYHWSVTEASMFHDYGGRLERLYKTGITPHTAYLRFCGLGISDDTVF